ncbi:S-layer protein domain-containing protein, partial [Methanohalophilus halophilus]
MKRLIATLMAALMVLTVFAGVASAAGHTVEVRGTVTDFPGGTYTWDAQNFPGFWYDLDENESSETLEVTVTGSEILEGDLVYTATAVDDQTTEFGFTESTTSAAEYTYMKLGLFAEEYFVVNDAIDTLSKILMDDDSSYTMRTGETL